jgi:hypothetical protein
VQTAQPQQQPQQPQFDLEYVNRPDVPETFADSLENVIVDGQTLRMEFLVHRLDEPKPGKRMSGKKLTALRVVMPAKSLVDVYNKLNNIVAMMEQQGVVQRNPTLTVLQPTKPSGPPN